MGMHGNYDLHTGFHGADEEIEPVDVFDEGDEDGIVWPIEPVLPLGEEFPPEEDEDGIVWPTEAEVAAKAAQRAAAKAAQRAAQVG